MTSLTLSPTSYVKSDLLADFTIILYIVASITSSHSNSILVSVAEATIKFCTPGMAEKM